MNKIISQNTSNLSLSSSHEDKKQIDIRKSLSDVQEDIEKTKGDITTYVRQLEKNNISPSIKKEWYELPIVTVYELNKVFNDFHGFIYRSFNLINVILKAQNSNTKNLCDIILLVSAAEAQLFCQLKELTTIDQEDIENLQKLEKQFLKSLEEEEKDKTTVHEQFEKLIDYMQALEVVKNKWIRDLEVKINDVYHHIDRNIENATNSLEAVINEDRKKQERSINEIKEEVNTNVNNLIEIKEGVKHQQLELQKLIDGLPERIGGLCDERFYKMQQSLSTAQESFQSNFSQTINNRLEKQDDKLTLQDTEINKLKKKSFFDSSVYKIGIGIIAIAALVYSLLF